MRSVEGNGIWRSPWALHAPAAFARVTLPPGPARAGRRGPAWNISSSLVRSPPKHGRQRVRVAGGRIL